MHADTLPEQRIADWNAIEAHLTRMREAWGDGDATAYAGCFSEDATYVIFVGTVYIGRAEIERSHAALFAKFAKGTTMAMTVRDVRFHGPDTATVVTSGDAAKRPKHGKVQSYTFHRRGDGWECVAFQNTKRSPLLERVSFLMDRRFRPEAAHH